jgi:hypothetical protein
MINITLKCRKKTYVKKFIVFTTIQHDFWLLCVYPHRGQGVLGSIVWCLKEVHLIFVCWFSYFLNEYFPFVPKKNSGWWFYNIFFLTPQGAFSLHYELIFIPTFDFSHLNVLQRHLIPYFVPLDLVHLFKFSFFILAPHTLNSGNWTPCNP